MAGKKTGVNAAQVEVRILVDTVLEDGAQLKSNSVATLDAAVADAMVAAGVEDAHPEAVKAAKAE